MLPIDLLLSRKSIQGNSHTDHQTQRLSEIKVSKKWAIKTIKRGYIRCRWGEEEVPLYPRALTELWILLSLNCFVLEVKNILELKYTPWKLLYKKWLQREATERKATCTSCTKEIYLYLMGECVKSAWILLLKGWTNTVILLCQLNDFHIIKHHCLEQSVWHAFFFSFFFFWGPHSSFGQTPLVWEHWGQRWGLPSACCCLI